MARQPKEQPRLAGNLDNIKATIKAEVDKMLEAEKRRELANKDIAAAKSAIEAVGVKKKALAWAISYFKLDADQREDIDLSFAIVREAIGLPVQADLFDTVEPGGQEATGGEKTSAGAKGAAKGKEAASVH